MTIISREFVSPDDSDYRLRRNFLPKTKYRVVLGYYPEYDESDEDEGSFKVMDTMRVWTKTVNCDFTVRSITSSGIEYALSINDDYPAYSARAVLYDESGNELSENEVDVSEAANGEVTEWFDAAVGENVRTYRLELQIFAANSSQATVLKTITAKNPYYNSGSGSGSSGTSGGSTSGGSTSGGNHIRRKHIRWKLRPVEASGGSIRRYILPGCIFPGCIFPECFGRDNGE